jgi:transposase
MSSKRRRFTPEFRAEAVRLVTETGRPIAHVAAEIGVGGQLLGRWVQQSQPAAEAAAVDGPLDINERAELERLRKENADLRLDRSFLKKAAVYAGDNCQAVTLSSFVRSSR